MLGKKTLDRRVADAELIVIGVLGDDVRLHPREENKVLAEGRLIVEDVLWGPAHPDDCLAVRRHEYDWAKWPRNSIHVDWGSLRRRAGRRLLWFLRGGPAGWWYAGAPDEMADPCEQEPALHILEAHPVSIRIVDLSGGTVDLVFRNTTHQPILVPAFRSEGGKLLLAPGASLKMEASSPVHRNWREVLSWRDVLHWREALRSLDSVDVHETPPHPGSIGPLPGDEEIVVQPGTEYAVRIAWKGIFALGERDDGALVFTVQGHLPFEAVGLWA